MSVKYVYFGFWDVQEKLVLQSLTIAVFVKLLTEFEGPVLLAIEEFMYNTEHWGTENNRRLSAP